MKGDELVKVSKKRMRASFLYTIGISMQDLRVALFVWFTLATYRCLVNPSSSRFASKPAVGSKQKQKKWRRRYPGLDAELSRFARYESRR